MYALKINPEYQEYTQLRLLVEKLRTGRQESGAHSGETLLAKNSRNAVYELQPEWAQTPIVRKRSQPNPGYRLSRKISFYLRNYFRHYGRRGYRGARLLQEAGIATITPLAYWKERQSLFAYQSCLAYEKVEADWDMLSFLYESYEPQNAQHRALLKPLFFEMADLARKMHDAGVVHGDLVPNNYLVKVSASGDSTVTVIDTDHAVRNRFPIAFVRRFFAMRCFRRVVYPSAIQRLFLERYLKGEGNIDFWLKVVDFWRWSDRRPISRLRRKLLGLTIPDRERPAEKKRQMPQAVIDELLR